MKKILDLIGAQVQAAFADAGYEARYGRVTLSNRPDLCEYQCNGALAAAKAYHKAPIVITEEVLEKLEKLEMFSEVSAVKPGFLNLKLSGAYLVSYLSEMAQSDKLGCGPADSHRKVVLDYGGPNVAKPLHVGHLRSAVIGESLKRICRFMGDEVIGDVHLGDWGLQMGLIIEELKDRQPELPYFDENYRGDIPKKRLSPYLNWKKSIPRPAPVPRRTKFSPNVPMTLPSACRTASRDTGLSGNTLCGYPLRI